MVAFFKPILNTLPYRANFQLLATQGVALGYVLAALSGRTFSRGFIYQFVSVGSMNCKVARIGNDVYIGPNACIVENVTIGDGATIGAGSVVVKDVPAGATVAGNPAKVISWKEPGRYVWRKWKVSEK